MDQEEFLKYLSSLVAHYNTPSLPMPVPPPGSERTPLTQSNIDTVHLAGSTSVPISFNLPSSTTIPLPVPSSSNASPMNISPEIHFPSFPILIPSIPLEPPPQTPIETSSPSLTIPDVGTVLVTRDPEPLHTMLHGEEVNPIDPDLGFDIKATGAALKAEGKTAKFPTRRSKRMFEGALKKGVDKLALKRRKQRRKLGSQRELKDEKDSESVGSDANQHSGGVDANDGSADLLDVDISEKMAEAESDSSSEAQKKSSRDVAQHPGQKTGGPSLPESDKDSVASKRKPFSRRKERTFKRKEDIRPLTRVVESGSAEEAVSGSRKQRLNAKGKGKLQTNIPSDVDVTLVESDDEDSDFDVRKAYNEKFYTHDSKQSMLAIRGREIWSEKKADVEVFKKFGLDLLLKDRCLWGTVVNVWGYEPNIVREFYANFLKNETSNPESKKFCKTFVRGMICNFSHSSINQLFGLPNVDLSINTATTEKAMITELSGGKLKQWSSKTSASQLTCKYAALYKIAINNWMPTSNQTLLTREQAEFIYKVGKGLPFNFGSVVVTNILRAASKSKSSNVLPYPSLIYRLLKDQGYQSPKGVVLENGSALLDFEKALVYSDKRVQDLPYKLPPLSKLAPDVADEVEDVDDVDLTSPSNIALTAARQLLPLVIRKVEAAVAVLEDLKAVTVSLKRLQSDLSPANF